MKYSFFTFAFLCMSMIGNAQEDMLSAIDSVSKEKKNEKVYSTFKAAKVVNANTIETVAKNTLDFSIAHRFGNIGVGSNGGGHTLYGFDVAENIRLSFHYGITEKIMIGIGRSKRFELFDGLVKYRFLEQTRNNKIPVSIAFFGSVACNAQRSETLYAGTVNVEENWLHRLSYVSQLIIARKFSSRFSLEITPTYTHRNFITALVNPDNGALEENDLLSMGMAARFKITKRFSLVAEYFYTLSEYRMGNSIDPHYDPVAFGVEVETGGHVFHINITNAAGLIEQDYIPNTTDNWLDGGFKLGFNISRVFYF